MLRKPLFSAVAAFVMLGALVLPATSADALAVSSASLSGGMLRVDGTNAAPGVFVKCLIPRSSSAGARSDYFSCALSHSEGQLPRGRLPVVVSDGATLTPR